MHTADLHPLLDQLQADTLAVLDRAKRLLAGGPEQSRAALAEIRWELARKVREYQLFKHSRIFDPAVASGSPSLVDAGRRLKADCIAGGEGFHRYMREWSSKDIAANWPEFRLASLAASRQVQDHVAAEGVQIRLLLAAAERQEARCGAVE